MQPMISSEPAPLGFARVLLAVDQSLPSQFAVEWTRRLAGLAETRVCALTVLPQAGDAAASALHVSPPVRDSLPAFGDVGARAELGQVVAELTRGGVQAYARVAYGRPDDEIVAAARDVNAELIIIGSRGAGRWERLTVGSVSDAVRAHTDANILIAKAPYQAGPILAAVDGSPHNARVALVARSLSEAWHVPLTLLHVTSGGWRNIAPALDQGLHDEGPDGHLLQGRQRAKVALAVGPVADRILDASRRMKASLIVMGSRGWTGFRAMLGRSVSNKVVHEADVPVLLARGPSYWPSVDRLPPE